MPSAVMNCWNEEPQRLLVSIESFRQVYPGASVRVLQDGRHRPEVAEVLEQQGVHYSARRDQTKNYVLAGTYLRGWTSLVLEMPPPVFKIDPDTLFYRPLPVFEPHVQYAGRAHASHNFLFGGCIYVSHSFASTLFHSPYATSDLARTCEYWRGYSEDLFLAALAHKHAVPLTHCPEIYRYTGTHPPPKANRLYAVSIKSGDAGVLTVDSDGERH